MIRHQNPSVKDPASEAHDLLENLEESDAVTVVAIDDSALVPAGRDVVKRPGKIDSQLT